MKAFDRRRFLLTAVQFGLAAAAFPSRASRAQSEVDLGLPGGTGARTLTKAGEFGQKSEGLILQRTRAALLETPMSVFDEGVFTPNDKFYVRWHWADIPDQIDADTFRLTVRGHTNKTLSLSLKELMALPHVEIAAVNQCSGNSRGFFAPRVPGGEWGNGAMGNAKWTGVRLKDVLDPAGIKPGALNVRFNGLDQPTSPDGPDFMKSLSIDHARDGEVMIAYAMNGKPLPLLNGFPLRLIVPGWYATYWVKMLSDIEILDHADENFWMKTAYLIPDRPFATIKPGETGVPMVPISKMLPRSFVTNIPAQSKIATSAPTKARGIAFGGDCGVKEVSFSADDGKSWHSAKLGKDEGKYGFRRWEADFTLPDRGAHTIKVRCTNTEGNTQPEQANWNGSGYMRSVIEAISVEAV
jgi:DMSO/TMAO reductase YedYZ molybdopterin-dependent catalytic subunit